MCGSPSFGEASSVEGKRVRACLETCGVFAVSPWCGQQIAVCLIIGNLLVGFTGRESFIGKVTCLKVGSCWLISL